MKTPVKTEKKNSKTNHTKSAFVEAYSKIKDIEQRITALHYALNPLREKWNRYGEGYNAHKNDFSRIHSDLYGELNDAYRAAFMWASVSGDKSLLAQAKKLAFDRFLKENSAIMEYLGIKYSQSYSSDLEKEFRAELEFLEKSS